MLLKYTTVSAALAVCVADAALYDQVIQTKYGAIQGIPALNGSTAENLTDWEDISLWKGISFAASTAGNNRWKPPQPAAAWNGTKVADTFGAICPSSQMRSSSDIVVSEDCLNLNIWSAAKRTDAKLPVVMWSYPAGGSNQDAMFTGAGMATKDIVFVNYNYRTGVYGWMAHPELSLEREALNGHNSSGNWGMLDQFAALKWIKENIRDFGGDPDHITVMGQSAGSAATYHILNSPLTEGLIVGAIIESGVRDPHDPLCASLAENYVTLDTSLEDGEAFISALNVSSVAAARELSTDVLDSVSGSNGFTATLDYYAMPDTYEKTLLKGLAHQVPVLTGNTKDESGATYGLNITLATYLADLNSTYNGTWIEKFLELYPANDSITASGAYNSMFTDRSKYGTWSWAQLWYKASTQPVYTYFWDHAPPTAPGRTASGASHESEIYYVLNNLYGTDLAWTADDYSIARTMNDYWANFIKTGNPNGRGLRKWPVTDSSPTVQRVGNGFEQIPVVNDAKVELFREWFASLPAY